MNDINNLFFELIRVALGTQETLSRYPSAKEWKALYDMAKKQSLLGICFAGVQKTLSATPLKGEDTGAIGLPEILYLKWMGMAGKIQQRNQTVDEQCVTLHKRFAADGFKSCILKGQANAAIYPQHLKGLRQSGDIDVWIDAPRERILEYVRSIEPADDAGELHVGLHIFQDTEVEVHFTPSIASGRKTNMRLQEWFEKQKHSCFSNKIILADGLEIVTPTKEFNLVYLMHHIFRHYLYEGVGLRQMLDYYFTLVSYANVNARKLSTNLSINCSSEADESLCVLKILGLMKFSGAVMYVMREVFAIDEKYMIFPVDEKRGRRLLEVVMEGGNFGHSTEKYKVTGWDKPWSRLSRYVRRNWFLLHDYPDEIVGNIINKVGI